MLKPSRLVQIRMALELSQEALAHLLGFSFATVNRWQNRHSAPTGAVLEVYRALDASLQRDLSSKDIVRTSPRDPGRQFHRIFELAYGGDDAGA